MSKKKKISNHSSGNGVYKASACSHIKSSIETNKMNKLLKQKTYLCEDCQRIKKNNEGGDATPNATSSTPNDDGLWICLKCGKISCGRSSTQQHALKHYSIPRSDSHALSFCPSNGMLWCYSCDDEVNPEQTSQLNKVVSDVMKWYQNGNRSVNNERGSPLSECNKNTDQLPLLQLNENANSSKKLVMHGLVNLGNTCYFNSVVQCLVRTPGIGSKLCECLASSRSLHLKLSRMKHDDEDSNESDLNVDDDVENCTLQVDASDSVTTTTAFLHVYKQLMDFSADENSPRFQKGSPVNPQNLRQCLGRVNRRFSGFAQQDSHELLRTLLDTIKQEEVRRFQASVLAKFNFKKSTDPKSVPDNLRQQIRHCGQYVQNSSGVDHLFGSCLISSVTCTTCNVPSLKFEHFLDLSLAIDNRNRSGNFSSSVQDNNHCGIKRKTEKLSDDEGNKTPAVTAKNKSNQLSNHQAKKAKELSKKEKRRFKKRHEKGMVEGDIPEKYDKTEEDNGKIVESISENDAISKTGKSLFKSVSLNNIQLDSTIDSLNVKNVSSSLTKRFNSLSILYCDTSSSAIDWDNTASMAQQFQEMDQKSTDKGYTSVLPAKSTESGFIDSMNSCQSFVDENKTSPSVLSPDQHNDGITTPVENSVDGMTTEFSVLALSTINGSNNLEQCDSSKQIQTEQPTTQILETSNMNCVNDSAQHNGENDSGYNHSCDSDIQFEAEAKKAALESLCQINDVNSLNGLEQCLYEFIQPELLTGSNKIICENCSNLKKKAIARSGHSSGEVSESREYRDAQKRYLMFTPPPILTIHLKRFHQCGRSLQKINKHVSFSMKLDASPYFSKLSPNLHSPRILYRLYGIVEHMGSLNGGHYVSYVCRSKNTSSTPDRFMSTIDEGIPIPSMKSLVETFHKYRKDFNREYQCDGNSVDSLDESHSDDREWFRISDSSVSSVSIKDVLNCQAYILFYERLI